MSAAYIENAFQLTFITEVNSTTPDQTALRKQSDLCSYCLQYRLPKYIYKQMRS